MADSEDHKRCPDCAEQVLAAARKCRYCGYRFDGGRGSRSAGALSAVIPGLVQARRDATIPEILADWNVSLALGEEVRFFVVAVADDLPGYLLVTSDRVIFFAQESRRVHAAYFAYPLATIRGVRRRGPRWRPRLILCGPDRRHELSGVGATLTRRVDGYLGEHGVVPLEDENKQPTV